jgi:hypothetical protein
MSGEDRMKRLYGDFLYFTTYEDGDIEMGVWESWNHYMTPAQAEALGKKLIALAACTPTHPDRQGEGPMIEQWPLRRRCSDLAESFGLDGWSCCTSCHEDEDLGYCDLIQRETPVGEFEACCEMWRQYDARPTQTEKTE